MTKRHTVLAPNSMNTNSWNRPANGSPEMTPVAPPTHMEMANMTDTNFNPYQIVADLRGLYIKTPRDSQLRSQLDRLLQRNSAGQPTPRPVIFTKTGHDEGDTRGIVLVEGAGGGKTSLIHHVLSTHPALQGDDPESLLWLGVRVPSPATTKSLGLEILRATGYEEVSGSRKEWDIWKILRHRLRERGTVVLWIDEAHDLFRAGKQVEDILRLLKSVMQGPGAVIMILSGVESLWNIASHDDQVKRRYAKVTLPAVSVASHGDMFVRLMGKYCEKAELVPPPPSDLISRLVFASRGRFGRCIENIISAIETALLRGDKQLTADHFAEDWAIQEGAVPGKNVFLSPRWAEIELAKVHVAA
ncbi:ATP-binding protein [Pseudooceanicola sp. LIPI14-2-Ac024]|uniref:ATP-binding protein n=1 Tax=Pseudooceanicola sp. LIPI14-2-Ac024 TaxID=3344875 RepID=UPI0035CEB184